MERQLSITEARKQLAHIVDLAEHKGENCIIIRHGQPAAVIVSMEVYLQWKKEREDLLGVIKRTQAANVDAGPEQVTRQDLEARHDAQTLPIDQLDKVVR